MILSSPDFIAIAKYVFDNSTVQKYPFFEDFARLFSNYPPLQHFKNRPPVRCEIIQYYLGIAVVHISAKHLFENAFNASFS